MKLGLLRHDPEEEQDCFSDNTHNSHYYDVEGMRIVYGGTYKTLGGKVMKGPSASDLVQKTAPDLNKEMLAKLAATHAAVLAIKQRAETKEAYDQMIGPNNPEGNAVVQAAIDRDR